nr:hypothetical protein [Tanacetum cinerariifolium]
MKLEGKMKKRIHRLKRLYKVGISARVESSEDVEANMFGVNDLNGNEVVLDATTSENVEQNVKKENLIEIKAAKPKGITTATITTSALTKPKEKGVMIQELSEFRTTPTLQPSKAKDKGKAIMIKPEKPLKKKDQIAHAEEVTRELEAQMKVEMEEEERLAKEKHEANIVLIA